MKTLIFYGGLSFGEGQPDLGRVIEFLDVGGLQRHYERRAA